MKIVIVGGGTAGWLSALFMTKLHPEHEYTIIEDNFHNGGGPIGVGEGSTGLLDDVIQNRIFDTGGDVDKFVKETESTPKIGIEFKGWGKKDFFSPIDASATFDWNPDILTLNCIQEGIPAWKASNLGLVHANNRIPFYYSDKLQSEHGVAWHFNGFMVGQYFKSLCSKIEVVREKVTKVNWQYGYAQSIKLESGEEVEGDFFIDATGFTRLFSCIDDEFINYSKQLPLDTVITFSQLNKDIDNTKPVTEAIAMNNGWLWKIPVGNRYKYGYVYSSKFTEYQDAMDELKMQVHKTLDKGIHHRTREFECKALKRPWNKNVLRIGLSAGFLEPLQATSIHSTIASLIFFTTQNFSEDANEAVKRAYNNKVMEMNETFVDFISLHYQGRRDTDFWQYMNNNATDKVKEMIYMCKSKVPHVHDLPTKQFHAGYGIWVPTLDGLGYISKDVAEKQLKSFPFSNGIIKEEVDAHFIDKTTMFINMISNGDFMRRFRRD